MGSNSKHGSASLRSVLGKTRRDIFEMLQRPKDTGPQEFVRVSQISADTWMSILIGHTYPSTWSDRSASEKME